MNSNSGTRATVIVLENGSPIETRFFHGSGKPAQLGRDLKVITSRKGKITPQDTCSLIAKLEGYDQKIVTDPTDKNQVASNEGAFFTYLISGRKITLLKYGYPYIL
jgi:hypothetical protein